MGEHNSKSAQLWKKIKCRLDKDLPDWQGRIEGFGQVAAAKLRAKRGPGHLSNEQVFEALVRSLLSNNTNWKIVEPVLPMPDFPFHGYDMQAFAQTTNQQVIENYFGWFLRKHAGSMTLKRGLFSLRRTAQTLLKFAVDTGCRAEQYFLNAIESSGGDAKLGALRIGTPGDRYKLPGFGIPLAAEALRNMGFDICKPDRHVCRAAGSFGFVQFRNWPKQDGYTNPVATSQEMLAVMAKFEDFRPEPGMRTSFVDNAVWLLCARSGLHLNNQDLRAMSADN